MTTSNRSASGSTLPSQSVRQLVESGFVIRGPTLGDPFNELTAAYDEMMAAASGRDFKIASMMIIFNGAIWHGHTANVTPDVRRSIQGYFVRRSARSGFDFRNRLPPAARDRMSPLARYLLALDDEPQ